MSTDIKDNEEMVSVSAVVLQDLLWNIALNSAGMTPTSKCAESIINQAAELQHYLTPEGYTDPNEGFEFDENFSQGENVHYIFDNRS